MNIKEKKLSALYQPFKSMEDNPFVIPGSTQMVFGEGPADTKIMIIGEAPGKEEDLQGRPFVGRSGRLLTKSLESIGLARTDIYITNIVKTRPPNNRTPLPAEIETGRKLLLKQIEIIQPTIICTLGACALVGLDASSISKPIRITKIRGKIFEYQNRKLLPTLHPAYILRNPSAIKLFLSDLLAIKELSEKK
jgi:uracil-DNA glycosylase